MHPKLIAHRGWTRHRTENTREAIEAAIDLGAQGIEFDVRRTSDARWVVYHDADLVRLHGLEVQIDQVDWEELRALADIPALDEVLDLFSKASSPVCAYIEVKQPDTSGLDDLCRILRSHSGGPLVVMGRGDAPEYLLAQEQPAEIFRYCRDIAVPHRDSAPVHGYDLWSQSVAAEDRHSALAPMIARGQRVVVWTINDPLEASAWIDAGADAVITDRLETLPD